MKNKSNKPDIWLRVNQAGYKPQRVKTAVVLSDNDITGETWSLEKDGVPVLSGNVPTANEGDNFHIAQKFYYYIDFSAATEIGTYTLKLSDAEAQIIVSDEPYSRFAAQALVHVRAMRSGDPAKPSHLGDAKAIAYEPDGDWQQGVWKETVPRRTIDMRGGHYDAGDFIKFTLTEASMVWHLLMAYENNTAIPGLLEEIKYGLDYLAKTFPDENTFVIQVGDAKDHSEGWRLPENDLLDGKRPALCALSRVHMGLTAAALALGAYVFKKADENASTLYEGKAIAIYNRARKNDTQLSAFERDATNDFYYGKNDVDNMALAAAELYHLTQDRKYLDDGTAYAPPSGKGVSWSMMNGWANLRLAKQGDNAASNRLYEETSQYHYDNSWQLPLGSYCWSILPIWIGMANLHLLAQRLKGKQESSVPFISVLDYIFGCNNWGIAMLASPDLPYSIRNIYNQRCNVQNEFPTGALSEGPGDKATHDTFKKYFNIPEHNPFEIFNTDAAVFYDNSYDFMVQESTIWGQGNVVLMLALASDTT